jgi:hypothetical protein
MWGGVHDALSRRTGASTESCDGLPQHSLHTTGKVPYRHGNLVIAESLPGHVAHDALPEHAAQAIDVLRG